MPVIFSPSKFINFTIQTAVQQADTVALWLSITVAVSWSVASQSACGRPAAPLVGHRLTDWAKQKSALERSSLSSQHLSIQPWRTAFKRIAGTGNSCLTEDLILPLLDIIWRDREPNTPTFLPARRYASAGYRDRNVSVCPSVCHAPVLCQNEES